MSLMRASIFYPGAKYRRLMAKCEIAKAEYLDRNDPILKCERCDTLMHKDEAKEIPIKAGEIIKVCKPCHDGLIKLRQSRRDCN